MVENNELGEEPAQEERIAVKNDALGEVSAYETPVFGSIPNLSGYLYPFTSGKRHQLTRKWHRGFPQHDEIDHDHGG